MFQSFSPDTLAQAAWLRLAEFQVGELDDFGDSELDEIGELVGSAKGKATVVASFEDRELGYFVCADGSLFYDSAAVICLTAALRRFRI